MSIALMTAAFKAPIKATPKLVLLALCDCANDQGECYPSVPTLMEKCSSGERTVQDAMSYLTAAGYMTRDFQKGRSTLYQITDPRTWRTPADCAPPQQPHPTPAAAAPLPPQIAHPTPAAAAPITINEPSIEPKRKKERASALVSPVGVDGQVWDDWLALRKAKRAPVSPTVVAEAEREACKAGLTLEAFLRVWCARGSQGLQADWLKPAERGTGPPAETAYARQMREKYEQVCPAIAAKKPGSYEPFTVDMEPANVVAIRMG